MGYTRTKVFGAGPGRIQNRDFGAGFYASDQWRVNARLTVTLGLRYEPYWQPVAYNFDRTNWYPDRYTGVGSAASAGIVQANHDGISGSTVNNDMNNFMPRVGVAWRVTDKWVIRTGGRPLLRPAHRPDRPAGIPELAGLHLGEPRLLGCGQRLLAEEPR